MFYFVCRYWQLYLWYFCCTIINMKKLLLKCLYPLAEQENTFIYYTVMNGLNLLFKIWKIHKKNKTIKYSTGYCIWLYTIKIIFKDSKIYIRDTTDTMWNNNQTLKKKFKHHFKYENIFSLLLLEQNKCQKVNKVWCSNIYILQCLCHW